MRLLWYYFFKYYLRTGFLFYFKSIRIVGEENIPDKKAVLFVGNHQNALLDPLLFGTTNKKIQYFLTQAQVFKNPIVKSILLYTNMLPIYRIRDGYDSLSKNEETFQKCYKILNNKQTVLIFAEGSHSLKRRVRVLTKGFTRIAFGALEQDPSSEIVIIPIGFNYSDAKEYGSSVSVYYGKPISANYYWDNFNKIESTVELINEVSKQLKKLTTHIEDKGNYEEIVQHFQADNFLYPEKVNKTLENIDALPPIQPKTKSRFNPLLLLVKINSVFPLLIWRKVYPTIKEEEYISTFRFTVGITAFPVFYLLQTCVISYFFGGRVGLIYLFLSILSVFLLTKTKK
jgi:1-acyl-sn-glycerol-3-phosphate acyltransferase